MKNNKQGRAKSQSYQKYSTNPAEFQTWLDKIYSRLNLPIFSATVVIGMTVYFFGLLIAATFDFGREYINTPAIYIGIFGICLVSSVVRYASSQIHSVFEYFRPCLMIDDSSYKIFITRWFSKLANNTGNYIVAGGYGVLALLVAYSEFFLSPLTGRVQYGSMKPYFFEYFWYQPEGLWGKVVIIAFYGLCVAFPLGAATRLLYLNFAFMKDFQKFSVIPLTNILRVRFRVVINYYLFIYFTWSVGIGLFGIVFFNGLGVDSIVFLSILNILGIGAFIAPQLCYRSFVLASTKILTNQVLSDYYSNMQIRLDERMPTLPHNSDVAIESLNKRINWWVYDFSDILIFILAQIIIYGATFLQH